MTILEFIRKNSLLVLIVIAGVGAGLVMMDYSGKTSAFSRDFYIEVAGTGYDYPEVMNSGENGKEYLSSLLSATRRMFDAFDTNDDGNFSEQEQAALAAWEQQHPEVGRFFNEVNSLYNAWAFGASQYDSENVATTRAILHAVADEMGLHPSEEQIDAYLRRMPPFRKDDGSFNTELYQRLTGYRNGNPNRVQEELFRGVIADMMIWDAVRSLVTSGTHYNTKAQLALIDAFTQSVAGRTAWLPKEAVPTPADPSEDELKAFWESHKEQYKSPERRIVSVYTLTPGEESNLENLLFTSDAIMQELSQANGQGLDRILAETAENTEYEPFAYKQADGSTHVSYPLSTQEELGKLLADTVSVDGGEAPLAQVAFSEIEDAPTVEKYEADKAAGTEEKSLTIKQVRGFFTTADEKLKLVRIEAVEQPSVLPYEEAREKALADYRTEKAAVALDEYAKKLYDDMSTMLEEGKDMGDVFAVAAERGAKVENYGPVMLANAFEPLPTGMTDANIISTQSGKLAPLAVLADGARIASVDRRTVEDSPAHTLLKRTQYLPMENARLRAGMMQDWLLSAYKHYDVRFSEHVRRRNAQ